MSLADGAALVESKGFFDACNVPPWDTWVAYLPSNREHHNVVLCWVPACFHEVVGVGIDVNPERCIYWARDLQGPWREPLLAAGLLD